MKIGSKVKHRKSNQIGYITDFIGQGQVIMTKGKVGKRIAKIKDLEVLKENKMKKSELRELIREEVKKVLKEEKFNLYTKKTIKLARKKLDNVKRMIEEKKLSKKADIILDMINNINKILKDKEK